MISVKWYLAVLALVLVLVLVLSLVLVLVFRVSTGSSGCCPDVVRMLSKKDVLIDPLGLHRTTAARRALWSVTTSSWISVSDRPAILAALRAATSLAGQATARGPSRTGVV